MWLGGWEGGYESAVCVVDANGEGEQLRGGARKVECLALRIVGKGVLLGLYGCYEVFDRIIFVIRIVDVRIVFIVRIVIVVRIVIIRIVSVWVVNVSIILIVWVIDV